MTLFEKVILGIWIAIMVAGITTMTVLAIVTPPFDMRGYIEELVEEAK